jgi:YggT family protein
VKTAGDLLVGACLMRLWLQMRRIPMSNPVGVFVMGMTDWIVKPLRRIVPGVAGIDWASVVAAAIISLAAILVIRLAASYSYGFLHLPPIEYILLAALVYLLNDALLLGELVVFLVAALSWINPFSPVLPILDALTAPLLRPIRRILPPVGRVDLSPLVLFVLFYICQIVLDHLVGH